MHMVQAQAPQAKSKVCGHPGLGCAADEQLCLISFLLTKKKNKPLPLKRVPLPWPVWLLIFRARNWKAVCPILYEEIHGYSLNRAINGIKYLIQLHFGREMKWRLYI